MKIKIEIEIDTIEDHDEIHNVIEFMREKLKHVCYPVKKPSQKTTPNEKAFSNAKK